LTAQRKAESFSGGLNHVLDESEAVFGTSCSHFTSPKSFQYTEIGLGFPGPLKELGMTTVTVSLSDEEMRRLEELSKREGLTVEQINGVPWHQRLHRPA
jgi:hypothetical protein